MAPGSYRGAERLASGSAARSPADHDRAGQAGPHRPGARGPLPRHRPRVCSDRSGSGPVRLRDGTNLPPEEAGRPRTGKDDPGGPARGVEPEGHLGLPQLLDAAAHLPGQAEAIGVAAGYGRQARSQRTPAGDDGGPHRPCCAGASETPPRDNGSGNMRRSLDSRSATPRRTAKSRAMRRNRGTTVIMAWGKRPSVTRRRWE